MDPEWEHDDEICALSEYLTRKEDGGRTGEQKGNEDQDGSPSAQPRVHRRQLGASPSPRFPDEGGGRDAHYVC